ncbi:hypothetical protein FDP41_005089 [Naegleria fowleri]|uniref:rRNA-processing protein FYV7 n=1 Tax=Naegleria fowleri TaxID=5763 RepID=A0A6A5BLN4_NAEFO|nr:uncharacterized protein FDP41_005089 [Naegleria fowleri]KAF0975762.1 hypothetical protein FDP41_005089 [Naegleria fowleri]CAG4708982.1 unnamed protein product [Naegleria fowleri]
MPAHNKRKQQPPQRVNNLELLAEGKQDREYKRKLDKISKDKQEKKKMTFAYLKTIKKMGYDFEESITDHKRKLEKMKKKKETRKDPFKKEREEFEKKKQEQQEAVKEKLKKKEELQMKHIEREKKRKQMRRTNHRGQPVFKHHMHQILNKLTSEEKKE